MLGQFPDRVYHFLTNKKRPRHEELFWPRKFLSKRFQEGQALDGPNLAFFDSQNVTGLQSGAPEKLHFLSGLAFLRTSLHCRCGCGCGCRCRLLYGVWLPAIAISFNSIASCRLKDTCHPSHDLPEDEAHNKNRQSGHTGQDHFRARLSCQCSANFLIVFTIS